MKNEASHRDRWISGRLKAAKAAGAAALIAGPLAVALPADAVVSPPTADVEVVFQAGDGVLWQYGDAGYGPAGGSEFRMAPGTSPSIAPSPHHGYRAVFQSSDNHIGNVQPGSGGVLPWPSGLMQSNTSPAITVSGLADPSAQNSASAQAMYQAPVAPGAPGGRLIVFRDGQIGAVQYDQDFLVRPGTSPAMTTIYPASNVADRIHQVVQAAFQGWDGDLWLAGRTNARSGHGGLGMAPGTSPAISSDGNGHWKVAFHAADNHLWTYDSEDRAIDTGAVMASGTSPAIAWLAIGGYEIAFVGPDQQLWRAYPDTNWFHAGAGLGVAPGTSPSITATPPGTQNGLFVIAFHAQGDHLWTYDGGDHAFDTGQSMAAGTSPAITYLTAR